MNNNEQVSDGPEVTGPTFLLQLLELSRGNHPPIAISTRGIRGREEGYLIISADENGFLKLESNRTGLGSIGDLAVACEVEFEDLGILKGDVVFNPRDNELANPRFVPGGLVEET